MFEVNPAPARVALGAYFVAEDALWQDPRRIRGRSFLGKFNI